MIFCAPSAAYSATADFDFTHYKKLSATRCFHTALTPSELERSLQEYLQNPRLYEKERAAARDLYCWKLDRKAGRRIGEYLLET